MIHHFACSFRANLYVCRRDCKLRSKRLSGGHHLSGLWRLYCHQTRTIDHLVDFYRRQCNDRIPYCQSDWKQRNNRKSIFHFLVYCLCLILLKLSRSNLILREGSLPSNQFFGRSHHLRTYQRICSNFQIV